MRLGAACLRCCDDGLCAGFRYFGFVRRGLGRKRSGHRIGDAPPASVVACTGSQPSVSTTTRIGDGLVHAVGQVGDGNVNATTTQFGNTSVTTGQVDGQPIAVTTIEIGNVTYTSGQVGGQPVSSSTIEIGDVTYTTGQ